jgi:hypothetical protein
MDKREKHQNRHKAQLRELEADVDNLRAFAKKTSADAKAGYKERMSLLERKLDTARTKVADLRQSSGDAWTELRAGVEHSVSEVKSEITDARKTLSAK